MNGSFWKKERSVIDLSSNFDALSDNFCKFWQGRKWITQIFARIIEGQKVNVMLIDAFFNTMGPFEDISLFFKLTIPRKNMNLPYSIRMYWTNFWQLSFISKYFCSFWQILRPNWSTIRGTVSLWSMIENQQIALIEGKCPRFRNSSNCLKTNCAANNVPIWT